VPADLLHQDDPHALLQHARAELRRRLLAGEPCRAETFFNAHPALASDLALAIELIREEVTVRRQLGQAPDCIELIGRFPQWHDWLAALDLAAVADSRAPAQLDDTVALAPAGTPGQAPADIPALGGHERFEEIGKGGMGVVYRARDLVLGRDVALKMIRPELVDGPDAVRRFCREARAAASLRHPNVVPIHGMGLHKGRHCFTMPLLPGGNLARQKDRFRNDVRSAVALMAKVVHAVAAAHERGIIHRDLKPGNILLDETGEPVVTDFGLAKFPGGGSADATQPGQRMGTPAYMAPEQAAGHTWKVTPATDVWALGVILYELIAGQRPFAGQDTEEVLQQILTAEPTPLRQVRPDLDPALEAVLCRCLQRDPALRYPSAGPLADDLQRWLADERVLAEVGARPAPAPQAPRRVRWKLAALAAAACITLAAAALYLHVRDPDAALREVEDRLHGGEPATLIGALGKPLWHQTLLGEGDLGARLSSDGEFTIGAFDPSLMALVRDPGPRYSLSAEVYHWETARRGEVGLFFGHTTRDTDRGNVSRFITVGFNDIEDRKKDDPAGKNSLALIVAQHRRIGLQELRRQVLFERFLPKAATGPNRPAWRRLAVLVRPESVTLSWEEVSIGTLSRDQLVRSFTDLQRTPDNGQPPAGGVDPLPAFGPGEPAGLYVRRGEASFRNVVVRPLP
jgi:serine/threonine-protein kinase